MNRMLAIFVSLLTIIAGLLAVLLHGCQYSPIAYGPVPPAASLPPLNQEQPFTASFSATHQEIPTYWGKGFILVQPTLNGKEMGWFLFDTGAALCSITAKGAELAGLPEVAKIKINADKDWSNVFSCNSLTLGPLTMSKVPLLGMNMSNASRSFDRSMLGVCGYYLCCAAVLEINPKKRQLLLHNPRSFEAGESVKWIPIEQKQSAPYVSCRYPEGREGRFLVDTGHDGSVLFFGWTVRKYDLCKGDGFLFNRRSYGYGTDRRISLAPMESFFMEGRDFGPLDAAFTKPGDDDSATNLQNVDGVIGMELLSKYRVLIDRPNNRIALLPL